MNFFDTLFSWFGKAFQVIGDYFSQLVKFLLKPLALLFQLLDGVFYFFVVLFNVVVKIIMIFVAVFQFLLSIGVGFLRTLRNFLVPSFNGDKSFPSISRQGFYTVMDIGNPIGLNTVVPLILLALVWMFWVIAITKLFQKK